MVSSAAASDTLLRFNAVSFAFNEKQVLDDINLSVKAGDFKIIIGPNGGGKSTLLKLAMGLLKQDRGSIELLGSAPTTLALRQCGYVPQLIENSKYSIHPATVEEIVTYSGWNKNFWLRLFRPRSSAKAEQIMELVGIKHLRRQPFKNLSLGEKQRVLIARALVPDVKVLFLDEPTASIDAAGKKALDKLLLQINQNLGITVVMVTHDLSILPHMSSHCDCLCLNCSLVYDGPAADLSNGSLTETYGYPITVTKLAGTNV